MRPKVSICIPAYGQTTFLRRTLQSIYNQDYKDYEIIITDDSPDDSVEKLLAEFPYSEKLKFYKNYKRKGSPENWNKAISLASGDYIKILHHDDWFLKNNSLAQYVAMLDNNSNANFAFSSTLVCGVNQEIKYLYSPTEKQIKELRRNSKCLFPINIIGSPSATIYRDLYNSRFDAKLKWIVDIDFYINFLSKNREFIFCSEPLICTTDGAPHQVTHECFGNKQVELFEFIYLYNKINKNYGFNLSQAKFIFKLIQKYDIMSVEDLKSLGLEFPIPGSVKCAVYLSNILRKMSL
jgi:glycosyltransferase involved in cell wall biosynthesis